MTIENETFISTGMPQKKEKIQKNYHNYNFLFLF